jgi:transcriptional regulator with GAF, ATPase, and Fis domain
MIARREVVIRSLRVGNDEHTVDVGDALEPAAEALKVVVMAGPDEGKEVPLGRALTVGSGEDADLLLKDAAVSRKHARLSLRGMRVLVEDLGSKNGTQFAGARVERAVVPLGAVVTLGKTQLSIVPRWQMRELPPSTSDNFGMLYGSSLAMREIFAILERVAPTDVTVLVEGESGTGKELVARSLHQASTRTRAPYVVFDCGAVPAELAESELFGHVRGAFSGAVASRAGSFAQADGGTLCLDELGELPLDLQPKLLRVLETGELKPVGADATTRVDVRVIASTNRDLRAEVRRGRFREDLLYRLDVVKLRVPPLRQRPEDLPGLVERLLEGKLPPGDRVDGDNLARLRAYGWPGNVRELRNVLVRAVALARKPGEPPARFSELVFNLGPAASGPTTLGGDYPGVASALPYKEARGQLLDSFDRAYVAALLSRNGDNLSRAAQIAGVSRSFLYDLIRKTTGQVLPSDEE